MSDGLDWIESEGTSSSMTAGFHGRPRTPLGGKAVSFRLADVASIDGGGGDKLTLKLKNGERHRFRVPSGKGWAAHLRAAR